MSRRKDIQYFKENPGDPPALEVTTTRRVRFEEVDPLFIVWHGRYPSYLEDGRAAFGEKYGLTYLDMYREQFMAPIAAMHIDYIKPLTMPDEFTIVTRLHWTDAVKLNFSYKLISAQNQIMATAYTVQILTNFQREVMLIRPPYIEKFCNAWKENRL
jgi:acyl-CoA thioester hydrolase